MELSALNDYSRNLERVTPAQAPGTNPGLTSAGSPAAEERRVLIQAVRSVNAAELFGQQHELSFAVDRESRRPVVRIVDRKTRTVVQQIPSESVLRLAEELKQAQR
jgi:formylmethanofuran dehydrogenase subunit B